MLVWGPILIFPNQGMWNILLKLFWVSVRLRRWCDKARHIRLMWELSWLPYVNFLAHSTSINNLSLLSMLIVLVPHLYVSFTIVYSNMSSQLELSSRTGDVSYLYPYNFCWGTRRIELSDVQTPCAFYYTLATTKNTCNMEHSCDFSIYVQ